MTRRAAIAVAVAAIAAAAIVAGSAPASTGAVRFLTAPNIALQGKTLRVAVAIRTGAASCRLTVKFSNGATQGVGSVTVAGGRADWDWQVPNGAKPGRATLKAMCGRAAATRSITVVGGLTPPKIAVENQGFSIRPRFSGTNVSFGVLLRNTSPNADALEVYVLVNMLLADGHVLGTSTNTIDIIGAGGTYALGDSLSFPGAAPIARLEVVVKVGGSQKPALRQPTIENIGIVPSRNDPTWVGEVNGELINTHPSLNLRRAKLSTVVLDAGGNIIGGGTGFANALLPPGTREAFVIRTGVDSIPWLRAASAKISVLATYDGV
jgi:hypothetical protein